MDEEAQSATGCVVAVEEAARLLDVCTEKIRQLASAARRQDVDGIHDLRVASRRLRSALNETALVHAKKARRDFTERAAAITRLLGKARELDVSMLLLQHIRPQFRGDIRRAATFSIRYMDRLRKETAPQVQAACALADAPDFERMRVELDESRHASKKCLLEHARKSIGKLHKRVHKAYTRWEEQPDEEHLHRVRVCFKKLRYACECHEKLYGKPMSSFIKHLKAAQESLGLWNDLRVLRDYVAESSQDSAAHTPSAPPASAFQDLKMALERRMGRMLQAFHRGAGGFFQEDMKRRQAKLFSSPQEHCINCPLFPAPEAPEDDKLESGDEVASE